MVTKYSLANITIHLNITMLKSVMTVSETWTALYCVCERPLLIFNEMRIQSVLTNTVNQKVQYLYC